MDPKIEEEPEVKDLKKTRRKKETKELTTKKRKEKKMAKVAFNVTEIPTVPEKLALDWSGISAVIKLINKDLDIEKAQSGLVSVAEHAVASATHYKGLYESVSKQGRIEKIDLDPTGNTIKLSWFDRLSTDITLGRTIAIRGPAGNGKSTGARYVLESKGYKVYHLDCTDSTTVDQLVGGIVPVPDGKGGISMEFKDGLFAKAFKDPKSAILLDEFDSLDPRVAICLQSALHRNSAGGGKRKVSASDSTEGHFVSKGDCPVLVTMNTYGNGATREYVGRNAMDAASMDRFDSIIDTSYEFEKEIIGAKFGEENAKKYAGEIEKVIKWADTVRTKINEKSMRIVLSTRRLIDISESVIVLGLDPTSAVAREFKTRLSPSELAALSDTAVKK